MGGVSAAVSKTAAAPIERVKLLIQVSFINFNIRQNLWGMSEGVCTECGKLELYSW